MTTTFTPAQIEALREGYGKFEKLHPDCLDRFHAIFAKCDDATLIALATAGIKFVSKLAMNACMRRNLELPTA